MDVFQLRDSVIGDYQRFIQVPAHPRQARSATRSRRTLADGLAVARAVAEPQPEVHSGRDRRRPCRLRLLHAECSRVFRFGKDADPGGTGSRCPSTVTRSRRSRQRAAGDNYVLTTGTGSGKSLSYIIPIVDQVLREGSGGRIKAIVVYPMNALANSQKAELEKFLSAGYPDGKGPVTFERYTGQENDEERQDIIANPPDILLTNYVMLELILTRTDERQLVAQAQDLRFLVLDELHTYRGRQGADVALLCRRVREACSAERLQCVGTSATLAGEGTLRRAAQRGRRGRQPALRS